MITNNRSQDSELRQQLGGLTAIIVSLFFLGLANLFLTKSGQPYLQIVGLIFLIWGATGICYGLWQVLKVQLRVGRKD